MRRDELNNNAPLDSEDNFRIRTIIGGGNNNENVFDPPRMRPYEVLEHFATDMNVGLNEKTVKKRRHESGPNELYPYLKLGFRDSVRTQLMGIMSLLFAAMCIVVYFFTPHPMYIVFAATVVSMTIANGIVEHNAGKKLEDVKKQSSLRTTVLRDGKKRVIDSRSLVHGDIVLLERGSIVPADCRLLESNKLTVLETPISGEENEVFKNSLFIRKGKSDGVCKNMVYGGTLVTGGTGIAIVCEVGEKLLIRKKQKHNSEELPSLLRYTRSLTRVGSLLSIAFCFLISLVSVLTKNDLPTTFLLTLGVGFCALFDSVNAAAGWILADGLENMLKKGAVVRRFDSIGDICACDSIMCNNDEAFPVKGMRVESAFTGFHRYSVTRENKDRIGKLLVYALACSDVKKEYATEKEKKKRKLRFIGNKVDVALARACRELDISLDAVTEKLFRIEGEYNPAGELERVLVLNEGKSFVIVKGAPEYVLRRCDDYVQSGQNFPFAENSRNRFLDEAGDMADRSQHVFAVAIKYVESDTLSALDTKDGWTFVGLVGLHTSIELNAASAVYRCNAANIDTVVFSRSPYHTAVSLAKDSGIIKSEAEAMTMDSIYETEHGLYVADNMNYHLFIGITDDQWSEVLELRKQNGRNVAYCARGLDDLENMASARLSLVSADTTDDTLLQCADVIMAKSGFSVLTNMIEKAKMIYKRIFAVMKYSVVPHVMLCTAMMLGLLTKKGIPFRIEELFLGGFVINLIMLICNALYSDNGKNLGERVDGEQPKLDSYVFPSLFGFVGGIVVFLNYNVGLRGGENIAYTMSFFAISFVLMLYCLIDTDVKSLRLITSNKTMHRAIPLVMIGVFVLVYTKSFGYAMLDAKSVVMALMMPLTMLLLCEAVKMIFTLQKNKKEEKRLERLNMFE